MPRLLPMLPLLLTVLLSAQAWTGEEEDEKAAAAGNAAQPELTPSQREAVGISLIHPRKASAAERIDAYGETLDVAALIADSGHLASAHAAERAAHTEAQRLAALYKAEADASLRAVETAEAAEIEARTQLQIAESSFALQWGPLAQWPSAQRDALIAALSSGRAVLLRADLPGRLRLASVPQTATVTVDGAPVAARVLGPLPRSAEDSQSVGLLLQIDRPPVGLGTGARLLVSLHGAASSGVLVPNAALLYGEQGVYVYRQLEHPDKSAKLRYAPVPVKLLQAAGDAWLVQGVDDDDLVVANGAGVLWSLQGLGTFTAEEEDHD